MPALIAPTVRLHSARLAAHREWGPGRHEDTELGTARRYWIALRAPLTRPHPG
ncbi:hypothetical protein [Micromonospora sp. MA102]|uniref:hypothetical protein n=1 Tax=Micromonospora sp. MA102 TaxID=2952755 RepID=UPI0021C89F95|nr:hypothetical protein [Micromonospora sp. MA102]